MATVLSGQDSVSASGMTSGHDVYCGYGGSSSFSNMGSVMARFPGKKYLVFDTHVSQVDCYDIEPGGGSASLAPAFFRQWRKVNLDKPAFYASASQIGSVQSALSAAGIARSSYYLIVAQWDGSPSIPGGFDGKQYGNTAGYDSDSFYDYMWGGGTPVPPASEWPLAQGSTFTADVVTLQKNLNTWSSATGLKLPLKTDGKFGLLTAAAVTLAITHFGLRGVTAGTCPQSLFNDLKGTPGTVTPPPPPPPAGTWYLSQVKGLSVVAEGTGAHVSFSYPSAATPSNPGKFEIRVSQGGRLGAPVSGYPKYVTYIASGAYEQDVSDLVPGTQYTFGVRAMLADGSHSGLWNVQTVTTRTAGGGTVTPPPPPPPASGYRNPLRGIASLVPQRIDQGVDYGGSGPLYSLGNGTVLNTANAGWPGGTFISVRLSDGPAAGKIFYFAENITPHVSTGQRVTSDTVLGTLINAYPNCELGWAAEPGTGESMAKAAGNLPASHANTAYGKNFSDLLVSLGAPAGILSGPVAGAVEAGWPAWEKAPVTPPVVTPPPVTTPGFPLQQGSTGALVVNLQKGLNSWISAGLNPDGKFGPLTAAAVTLAQVHFSQHGAVPGVCDQALYDKLQTAAPAPAPSQYPSPSQAVRGTNQQINGEIMYGFFRQHGYSAVAAAGAIASIWGESVWDPESAGTGGNGLIGWTPPIGGIQTGNPGADMTVQLPKILSFVAVNGDSGAVASMQNAASVLDAANIWGIRVERYGINDVHAAGLAAAKAIALKLDGVHLA